MTDQPTQRELAEKAMFVKAEGLAARARRRPRMLATNIDGTVYYRVEKDRLGAPYAVYRDVSWYV